MVKKNITLLSAGPLKRRFKPTRLRGFSKKKRRILTLKKINK